MKNQSKFTGQFHASANGSPPDSASEPTSSAVPVPNEFTLEEHLRVQREIEERAHRSWFAKGCALTSALNDWLKAEAEVLAEFVTARTQRPPAPPVPNEAPTRTEATRSFPPAARQQQRILSKLQLTMAAPPSL
jgi:hypothetical protein